MALKLRCLSIVLLASQLGFSQQAALRNVVITVVDPSGALVANARIELERVLSDEHQSLQTDPEGSLRPRLYPGEYKMSIIKVGFDPFPHVFQVAKDTKRLTVAAYPATSCKVITVGHHGLIDAGCFGIEVCPKELRIPCHRIGCSTTSNQPAKAASTREALAVIVKIKIVDPTGAPIPHARLQLTSNGTGPCGETNEDGVFTAAISPGKYEALVMAQGFAQGKKDIDLQEDYEYVKIMLNIARFSGPVEVDPQPK